MTGPNRTTELESVVADLVELVKSLTLFGASPCKRGLSGTCAAHGWQSSIESCPVGRAYALDVQEAALCAHCGIGAAIHANRFTLQAGWHQWTDPRSKQAA